jgi:aspartyl/glutamyl-tRNA(Asn/Gln) amidotransferase C subunit
MKSKHKHGLQNTPKKDVELLSYGKKIDRDEFERIAALAKLDMRNDSDLKKLNYMKEIIDEIEHIQLDNKDSDPPNMEWTNTFREDAPNSSLPRKDVLFNAGKNVEAGCISVPKILGG